MPELPEVETVKNQLLPKIVGQSIINYFTSGKKLRREIPNLSKIINQKIVNIFRRNKYIVLELEFEWLVIHLGMTGQLTVSSTYIQKKHSHVIIFLADGFLNFEDPRRFGSIDLFSKKLHPDYLQLPLFSKLGIEPFDKNFTPIYLANILKLSNTEIKKFLMDSNIVSGIGNIYASEILFLTHIHPEKKAKQLINSEVKLLHINIIKVLKKAIALGGSSISDFIHTNGEKGKMQDNYNVYGRAGLACPLCLSEIEKINQAGRSSFFCPQCQSKI